MEKVKYRKVFYMVLLYINLCMIIFGGILGSLAFFFGGRGICWEVYENIIKKVAIFINIENVGNNLYYLMNFLSELKYNLVLIVIFYSLIYVYNTNEKVCRYSLWIIILSTFNIIFSTMRYILIYKYILNQRVLIEFSILKKTLLLIPVIFNVLYLILLTVFLLLVSLSVKKNKVMKILIVLYGIISITFPFALVIYNIWVFKIDSNWSNIMEKVLKGTHFLSSLILLILNIILISKVVKMKGDKEIKCKEDCQ